MPAMYDLRTVSTKNEGNKKRVIPSSTNVVHAQADAASALADHGAVLEGIVDALDGVFFHADKEARAELRVRRPGVEERRGCMGEIPLRHHVVGLNNALEVGAVNTDGDPHYEMLRAFDYLALDAEKV